MTAIPEIPFGAIENGRVFLQRLSDHYDFTCEAGSLANCSDYHEAVRCFEFIAQWISGLPAALPFLTGVKVKDEGKLLMDVTQAIFPEGWTMSNRNAVANGIRIVLSAIEVSGNPGQLTPSPRAQALEEGDNICARLEGLASWLDGSQHSKWCGRKEVPIHGYSGEGKLVRAAIAAIRALSQPVADGWLPIEAAPKDTVVLMTWNYQGKWEYEAGIYGSTRGGWLHGQATHWRPLPASPEVAE